MWNWQELGLARDPGPRADRAGLLTRDARRRAASRPIIASTLRRARRHAFLASGVGLDRRRRGESRARARARSRTRVCRSGARAAWGRTVLLLRVTSVSSASRRTGALRRSEHRGDGAGRGIPAHSERVRHRGAQRGVRAACSGRVARAGCRAGCAAETVVGTFRSGVTEVARCLNGSDSRRRGATEILLAGSRSAYRRTAPLHPRWRDLSAHTEADLAVSVVQIRPFPRSRFSVGFSPVMPALNAWD